MSETLSGGLTIVIPSLGESNWDQTIKTSCFQKISEHDHTGAGKGVQIATGAIANEAVTTAKIDDGAVTTAKIADDAVTDAKIRLANNSYLRGRNAAGTADIDIIKVNASDAVELSSALSIVEANIGSGAVTTAKINDGAVTEAKLDADAATRSASFLHGAGTITNGSTSSFAMSLAGGTFLSGYALPKAAKITHISGYTQRNVTSGSMKFALYKNGSDTGQGLTVSSAGITFTTAITAVSFAAGDTIEVYVDTSAVGFQGGLNSSATVVVWGHFTE